MSALDAKAGMDLRRIALGTIAYTVVTFPLAVLWHVVLLRAHYERVGYFDGEPNFALGLLTIMIQGAILAGLYPLVRLSGSALQRGLKFATLLGVFFWTSHVLAFMAKQADTSTLVFLLLETIYLILQFGIFGLLIARIYPATES